MKKIGFVVNPIAGMGGAVGLKGTDGKTVLRKARALGAKPAAPTRAELFLSCLKPLETEIQLTTAAGTMGAFEARNVGFKCEIIGDAKDETDAADTRNAAKIIMDEGADLLVFCGGDGTARDIMDVVNIRLPVLGVPVGVKMHSAVFAFSPESAARTAAHFLFDGLALREAEVMDVDEEAFRNGRVSARLYGYVLVPYEPDSIQSIKVASPIVEEELRNQAAIAVYLIDEIMKPHIVYILGPGTTTRAITDLLGEKKTLLGVDLLCDGKITAYDVNENEILDKTGERNAKIVVTPIGGQGFIFGRGNQQISSSVIKNTGIRNVIVVATKSKLRQLKKLRVDTGDSRLDKELRGQTNVIADYGEQWVMMVE
jgi:predicted polyphosphate/ATP-dependent NAD kinase